MYVIMDMEWIENHVKCPCPTQIAALRIDQKYQPLSLFSSLIRPFDPSCMNWKHVAYNGYNFADFLSAPRASSALFSLYKWLREDDILLWWRHEPANTFLNSMEHINHLKIAQPMRLIYPTAHRISQIKGSAYKMAQARALTIPAQAHVSTNDVKVIRLLMEALSLNPAEIPNQPMLTQKIDDQKIQSTSAAHACAPQGSHVFWTAKGYQSFHLRGCPKLNGLNHLKGYSKYSVVLSKGFHPCKFCKPSPKHDIPFSASSSRRQHVDESSAMLDSLCDAMGYGHKCCNALYYISTPVGKWRLHTLKQPIALWHINLLKAHGNVSEYHCQPHKFQSFLDTFNYILVHDQTLMKHLQQIDK